jgi:hypothetical protein
MFSGFSLDSSASGQGEMAGYYNHDKELSNMIKNLWVLHKASNF